MSTPGLACRCACTHCRAPRQQPRRAAAMELAAKARCNRGLKMHINKIHAVQTISLVARERRGLARRYRGRNGAGGRLDLGLQPRTRRRHHGLHRIRRRKPPQPHLHPSRRNEIASCAAHAEWIHPNSSIRTSIAHPRLPARCERRSFQSRHWRHKGDRCAFSASRSSPKCRNFLALRRKWRERVRHRLCDCDSSHARVPLCSGFIRPFISQCRDILLRDSPRCRILTLRARCRFPSCRRTELPRSRSGPD